MLIWKLLKIIIPIIHTYLLSHLSGIRAPERIHDLEDETLLDEWMMEECQSRHRKMGEVRGT